MEKHEQHENIQTTNPARDKQQKRDYTKPEIKKREQIKEVTEAVYPFTLAPK